MILRFWPHLSPAGRLRTVRLSVLALSIVAWLLATSVETIKELVELASAFGSAGAVVVALFGLFTRFGGPWAALATLVAGSLVWAGGRFLLGLSAPYLVALASALATYMAVALVETPRAARAPSRVTADGSH